MEKKTAHQSARCVARSKNGLRQPGSPFAFGVTRTDFSDSLNGMSRTRMLIISFWVFIGCMLLWQFYTYDHGLTQASIDHPRQTQFWFTNSSASTAPTPSKAPIHDGADVEQTGFSIVDGTPSAGSMTCYVTLKNTGNAKAVDVQVQVRPFLGASNYDEDVGQQKVVVVTEDNPISQINQWVSFPDLAPGESSTQSAVFLSRTYSVPGKNPQPKILFETAKGATPSSGH